MFHEVVRSGSYSAAARNLGYTQPAVSQQIRALERDVGTRLFTRVGRTLQLTEAGELLARHAVDILASLGAAKQQVAEIKHLRAGRVRVCAFPSASATIVAPAVAHLAAANPGIRVRLLEAEPPGSFEMLVAGECDIVVGFSYPEMPEPNLDRFRVVPLLDDEIRVVLPVGHRLAHKRSVDLSQLADETWIAGCPRCRAHFVSACEAAGFEPDIAFTTDDNLVVQSLVVAGVGVASMPGLVLSFMRHPQLVDRLLRPESRRSVAAYTLGEYERIPATALMLEALRTVSATLRPRGQAPRRRVHP
jgi:DNA-binding transcriptional LysR family regulator